MFRNRTPVPRFGFQQQDLASDRIFAELTSHARIPVLSPGSTPVWPELRRVLNPRRFYAAGLRARPALLVRGSSRRITIVRFRSADIRVINRRIRSSLSPVLLLIRTLPEILLRAFLDRVYFGFT